MSAESGDLGPRVLTLVTAVAMCVAVYMAFVFAPTEETMGEVQRIFYFHVSSAWAGMAAFLVVFIAGIGYLRTHRLKWDMLALSSAEIGVVFITMALVTGSLWARPTWNTWWTWEPRLTISLMQFLIYVGYLMLRSSVEDPARRARFAAVYGIVAFVSVPINYLAIRLWRENHPLMFGNPSEQGGLGPNMMSAFFFCLAAFTIWYVTLMWHRIRLERLRDDVEQVKQKLL